MTNAEKQAAYRRRQADLLEEIKDFIDYMVKNSKDEDHTADLISLYEQVSRL